MLNTLRLLGLLTVLIFLPLLSVTPADAQTMVSVDIHKAILAWDWTPGAAPNDGTAASFTMKCGKTTGVYTVLTPIADPAARSIPISKAIPGQGQWFCACTAVNTFGESPPTNEVSFNAGALPAPPANERVQAQ